MIQPDNQYSSAELAKHRPNVIWIDEVPWWKNGKILSPLPLPHKIGPVDRKKVHEAILKTGALLARWADHWDCTQTEWWYVCCDNPDYCVEDIESTKGRRDVRKGLRECKVSIIDPDRFAKEAYSVYKKAMISYGRTFPSFESYRESIYKMANYPGTHFWVAHVEDKLAAFSTGQLFDNAVTTGYAKSDPELRRHCPNNALFYEMARYYMQQGDVQFITNGSRTLLHPTTINDMLERMGFRKIYCRLNIELSPMASIIERSGLRRWGPYFGIPKILRNKWDMVESLHELRKIEASFK